MTESSGLLAEFIDAPALVCATRAAWHLGYRRLDAFAPYPLQALEPLLAPTASRVASWACIGAITGAALGMAMQIGAALAYPLNIGGRPVIDLPPMIVVTFLLAVLFSAFAAVLAMLWAARLPRLHHPLFATAGFERGNDDRFLLYIQADDPLFDPSATRTWLQARARSVSEVGP